MKTSKPNILFIMADQMAAPMLPMYNPDSVVQMPHLSQLAKEGVVFDSAYCNSPLCAPSRFSLVSGQLPSKIAGYDNAADFAPDIGLGGDHLDAFHPLGAITLRCLNIPISTVVENKCRSRNAARGHRCVV